MFWKQFLCTEDFSEFHYLTGSQFHFFEHLYYTLNLCVSPDGNGDAEASPSHVIFLHKGTNLCSEAKWGNAPIVLWVRHTAKWVEMSYTLRLCTGLWVHTLGTAAGRYIQVMLVNLYLYLMFFSDIAWSVPVIPARIALTDGTIYKRRFGFIFDFRAAANSNLVHRKFRFHFE